MPIFAKIKQLWQYDLVTSFIPYTIFMENALNQLDSPDSVTLLSGTAPEIGEALRQL